MAKSYFTLKFDELKQKFSNFFLHKKKVKAIENYVSVAPLKPEFQRTMKNYLTHINIVLENEFLDEIEERYLNDRLSQLEIDALDWCHKTKWLKKQMASLRAKCPSVPDYQLYFDLEKTAAAGMYPIELVASQSYAQPGVRK